MSEFVDVLDRDKAAVSHLQLAAEAIVKRLQSARKEDPKLVEKLLEIVKELKTPSGDVVEKRLVTIERQMELLLQRIGFCESAVGVKRPRPMVGGESAPLFQPG